MPEATSPQTSEPCSASTRGLPRLFRSTIAPSSASTKPVNRLLFFMHSPPARIPAPNHCDTKAGIVSPQPARWNVTGEESPTANSNYRQVCSEICVAKRTLRDAWCLRQEFRQLPHACGQTRFHGGGDAKRFVNPAEISAKASVRCFSLNAHFRHYRGGRVLNRTRGRSLVKFPVLKLRIVGRR